MPRWTRAIAILILAPAVLDAHPDTPRQLAEVAEKLRERPGDPDLLMQRGVLYLDEEYANYPQAIADLGAALKTPGRGEALIFRATAYLRTAQRELARRDLDRYIASGPPDPRAFELRAEVHAAGGQRQAAVEDLVAASRVAPRAEQYLRRAEVLEEDGRPKDAVTALQDGLQRLGAAPELALRLVDVGVRTGRFDAALAAASLLESQGGRREPWVLRRAQILASASREKEARVVLEELLAAIEARERAGGFVNQTLLIEKAEALRGLGRTEEARRVFLSLGPAARRLPDYARLAAALGVSGP